MCDTGCRVGHNFSSSHRCLGMKDCCWLFPWWLIKLKRKPSRTHEMCQCVLWLVFASACCHLQEEVMEEAFWSLTDLHSEHHNGPSISLEPSELVLHLQSREKLPREGILPNNLEIFHRNSSVLSGYGWVLRRKSEFSWKEINWCAHSPCCPPLLEALYLVCA